MQTFRLSVVIERDDDGYFAFCPQLRGCYAQGETYEEALENVRDAIRLNIEDRIATGDPIPNTADIALTSVDVAVE